MKKILLLTTGGTMTSSDTGSGLMPVAGARQTFKLCAGCQ